MFFLAEPELLSLTAKHLPSWLILNCIEIRQVLLRPRFEQECQTCFWGWTGHRAARTFLLVYEWTYPSRTLTQASDLTFPLTFFCAHTLPSPPGLSVGDKQWGPPPYRGSGFIKVIEPQIVASQTANWFQKKMLVSFSGQWTVSITLSCCYRSRVCIPHLISSALSLRYVDTFAVLWVSLTNENESGYVVTEKNIRARRARLNSVLFKALTKY